MMALDAAGLIGTALSLLFPLSIFGLGATVVVRREVRLVWGPVLRGRPALILGLVQGGLGLTGFLLRLRELV